MQQVMVIDKSINGIIRYDVLQNSKIQINPNSVQTITAQLEPSLKNAKPEDRFQFERHGYFVADKKDSVAGKPVFN